MDRHHSHEDRSRTLSRRRALAIGGGLVAGGVAWTTLGTAPVVAVTPGGFAVEDDSYDAPDGEVYSPLLTVEAAYSYDGVANADNAMLALLVDGSLLTSEIVSGVAAPSDDGTATLSAPVVESRAWTSDDWTPPEDGDVAHTLTVELRLEVRDSDNETLASASASDEATITVSDAGPTLTATVGGDGSVSFLPSEDATPTG